MWQEPIFDRTNADTLAARSGQSTVSNSKGALNVEDLKRIEGNFLHVVNLLFDNKLIVRYRPRKYIEKVFKEPTSLLPDGYTPLKSIKSSGTQYINTKFKPKSSTRVVMKAALLEVPTDTQSALFGARVADTSQLWAYWRYQSTQFCYRFGDKTTSNLVPADALSMNSIEANSNVFTVGNRSVTAAAATFESTIPMFLFAVNNNGLVEYPSSLEVEEVEIYDADALVLHYVPCINPEGVVGLLDTVNELFYGSDGTDAFIAGASLAVEYEQSVQEYADWYEHNIPWKSEVDRIRSNFNNLNELFLQGLDLDMFGFSDYLVYTEVNAWEYLTYLSKTLFENMTREYLRCNEVISGGVTLL